MIDTPTQQTANVALVFISFLLNFLADWGQRQARISVRNCPPRAIPDTDSGIFSHFG
jgi:hypothetical protein